MLKPGDVQHKEVAHFLANAVLSGVYKFLMPDHVGADTTRALTILGADRSQKRETDFLDKKRSGLTAFIITALGADSSIGWTDLAVNSADHLLNSRTQWRWYRLNGAGFHVITSVGDDGRRLHRTALEHVRVAADGYSCAVVAAIEAKQADNGKKARCDSAASGLIREQQDIENRDTGKKKGTQKKARSGSFHE